MALAHEGGGPISLPDSSALAVSRWADSLSPAAELIKKAAGIQSGSDNPLKNKVGKLTKDQVREIATMKLPDLNANDVEAACKIVEGTARSMGVTVE